MCSLEIQDGVLMPKRKNDDTKEFWFLKVVDAIGFEHLEQESYNFITHDNITNLFESLREEKNLRLTTFNPTRQEYLDEICKFITPTYEQSTGRIIQTNTALKADKLDMSEENDEEDLANVNYEKIVTLYFTKTGKTTTEFWKGVYEAYNSINTTKQSIMEIDIVPTKYEFLVQDGEEIILRNGNKGADNLLLNVPPFQRPFVWKKKQWDMWIDSIMVGIPTPPIIIARNDTNGRYEIIDGQQRITSMIQLKYNSTFQRRLKIDNVELLKQRIDNYPLVVYKIDPPQGLTNEQVAEYWSAVKTTFERLNIGGKRLRPVEIRAARYSETQLHKLVVDEIQKIISNTHLNENFSKQLREFVPAKKKLPGINSDKGKLTNQDIMLYDMITRRLAYSSYSDGDSPTSNNCIEKYFEITGNDVVKSRDDIEKMINSVDAASKIFAAETIVSCQPQPPPQEKAHKKQRSTAFIITTLTIGLEYSRYGLLKSEFDQLIDEHGDELNKAWNDFYWSEIDEMNQSSTNVWNRQRNWCEIVKSIIIK